MTNRFTKIRTSPKRRKPAFQRRKLLAKQSGAKPLELLNNVVRRINGSSTNKYVNVIAHYLHLNDVNTNVRRFLFEKFTQPIFNVADQNSPSVFRAPNQVIFDIVNRVRRISISFIFHYICDKYISFRYICVMQITKTYRYKLKPNATQRQRLSSWVGACRYVFNLAKETKEYAYKAYGISLSYNDLQNQLPELKTEDWIKDVPGQTLQNAVKRMDIAYQNFFRGSGYPKWAKKDHYNSITFPQNVKVAGNRVKLPKLGNVRFFNSRPCKGKIKQAVVNKAVSGWYISITCKVEQIPLPATDHCIGIDVGISHLAITSRDELIENPKHTHKYERQLRIAQRSLARKSKGSNNQAKQKRVVARLHEKIKNTRKDYHHKVSSRLVCENQAIACEALVVANMVKNRNRVHGGLSKAISDAGWGKFTTMLEYKCQWYGREFVKVPAAYTSRDCSACGHRTDKMPLNIRFWTCPVCSAEHQRDVNAAQNILGRAGLVSDNVGGLAPSVGQESARVSTR